jgi:cellulose synthase/poly-beta-1,6-N-acetylglucosamine synthase-like glycosyltransferase
MLPDELGRFFYFDLTLLTMFWYAARIEVPRFLIGALYMAGRELVSRRPPPRPIDRARLLSSTPSISVLLVGHNEGTGLERAIRGLREQTVDSVQIVVIDDGSTDHMAQVGRRLRASGLIDVFVSTGLRGGKAAAQNLGLTYCSGDIVVVSDVDTSFDRDALVRLIEPLADPKVGAVSGNLGVRNFNRTVIARFQAIQYFNSIAMGRRVNDMLYGLFIASGAFAAFRREALESVGGWSAGPGDDGDVTTRLRRAGWAVRFAPEAWALTDVPETLGALLRQRARWNRSFTMLRFRKHAAILNPLRRNFSLRDSLGTLDAVYFEAFRPAAYFVYVVWLFSEFGSMAWSIIAVVIAAYMIASIVLFLAAAAVSGHYNRLELLPYVPGAMLFNTLVLRPATVYAVLTELLWRFGYRDGFVPGRVLARIDRF